MGKRCNVCDGPVVNGRCKYCGMPYRSDMELYHLNENRSDHYRHASAKAKRVMAESEIPLPDRNKTSGTRTQKSVEKSVGTKPAGTKTAGTKMAGTKPAVGQKSTYKTEKTQARDQKPKKKSSKWFWVIILLLLAGAGQVAENWDDIKYTIDPGFESDSETDEERVADYYIFSGESYIVGETYIVTEEDENGKEAKYEMQIDAGEYMAEAAWEGIVLEIADSAGKVQTVKFDEEGQEKKIELHEKDEVSLVSLDGQVNYLSMYEIQQYDE
mgnify:FL=1